MLLTVSQSIQSVIGRTKFLLFDRYYTNTIRAILILTCIVGAAMIAVLLQIHPILSVLPLMGLAGLGVVIFLYRNMETGILIVLFVTTLFNIGVGTGTGTDLMLSLMLLLLLMGLWLLRIFLVERSFASFRSFAPVWPVLAFCCIVIIAMFWSSFYNEAHVYHMMLDKWKPRLMTSLVMIVSPLTTLLLANFMSPRGIKRFVWYFIVLGAFTAALRIIFTDYPLEDTWNIRGQWPVWVVAFALGQALFNNKLPLIIRGFCVAVVGAWAYIQIGLGITWLSGWVPVGLAAGIICLMYSRYLAVLIGIIGLIYLLTNSDMVTRLIEGEQEESGMTRVEAWDRAVEITSDHYLFGTGPIGYYFYLTAEIGGLFQLSHNNYFDIFAQLGIVGIAAFLAFWLSMGYIMWKMYWIVPRGGFEYGLAVSLAACYIAIFVVMALGDWVIPFAYTQTLAGVSYTIWAWMLMGIASALYFHCKDQQSSAVSAGELSADSGH